MNRTWSLSWRPSIFSKLLLIMLGMLAALLIITSVFFGALVFPAMMDISEHMSEQYARALAASSPNLESAQKIHEQTGLHIRYEGPDGSWSTSALLPSVEQVRSWQVQSYPGHRYRLETAPNGGTYLLVGHAHWDMRGAHEKLLWMLLALTVAVVLAAYWFQKRLLRPVRSLGEGVAHMSAGQLDVALPVFAQDELGVLTAAFNQMARRVKEMIEARDQLLLDVSHELRSPLTRMKVALALLPEDENKSNLDSDVNEMEAMISELLELERLRTPHGISRKDQDLATILYEVAQTFENRSPGVRLEMSPRAIVANIDRDKIRILLRNLLENAVKYSLPDSRPVEVSAHEDEHGVVIRVRDDGQGIPAEHMANIFEPFFRLDPSRSKKTGGYGLGLSICKRIIEAHGGTIEVENNPGRGATFTVRIPRQQRAEHQLEPSSLCQ